MFCYFFVFLDFQISFMCSVGQSFYFVVEQEIIVVEVSFGYVSGFGMFCDNLINFGCGFDVVFVNEVQIFFEG